jgi:cobalt-zinc-cadmium efflux system membrane fusion protein
MYACGKNTDNENTGNKQYFVEGDYISIPAGSPILQNIKTQEIQLTGYQITFSASGTVQAIPSHYAGIASPFAGRIVKSFVRLGQKVSPGSPLFEISSPSFFEAGKAYYQAKQEMEFALKNLNRERDLLANRVGVAKELEEAEVNYELRKKEYENQLASIKVYQINPEETAIGQPLIVRSPIAGEVLKNDLVTGQYIKEDADPLLCIADLNKVWVVAYMKEKDIHLLQSIAGVEIRLTALPDIRISGEIYHISELLDEETRSVEVIIECDNKKRLMKPQMYGTVRFANASTPAIVVPNSAVLQDENSRYVFIREGQNRFRKAAISVASTNEQQTVVLSGIQGGDEIITEGAV